MGVTHKVSDTFNFDISDSESEGVTSINLNGTIQGYTSYELGQDIMRAPEGKTAIDEAKNYLTLGLIGDQQFFKRANYLPRLPALMGQEIPLIPAIMVMS